MTEAREQRTSQLGGRIGGLTKQVRVLERSLASRNEMHRADLVALLERIDAQQALLAHYRTGRVAVPRALFDRLDRSSQAEAAIRVRITKERSGD